MLNQISFKTGVKNYLFISTKQISMVEYAPNMIARFSALTVNNTSKQKCLGLQNKWKVITEINEGGQKRTLFHDMVYYEVLCQQL